MLQKIYPVAPLLMAGFAGSVEIGFAMIEDMRRSLQLAPGRVWHPRIAFWKWWRRGRRIFQLAPRHLQQSGCSILMVGVSPAAIAAFSTFPPRGFYAHSYAVVMRSPSFTPVFVPWNEWGAIGSGTAHEAARNLAQYLTVDAFMGLDQAGSGTAAVAVATMVAESILKHPLSSVSEALQIGLVSSGGFRLLRPVLKERSDMPNPREIAHERLVTNWPEFVHKAHSLGLASVEAIA
jgi:hypothetical protein